MRIRISSVFFFCCFFTAAARLARGNTAHEPHSRNPGGVRFGSAEIYDVIEHCFAPPATHAAHTIVDCLAVGQSIAGGTDERVILFVKLLEGQVLTGELEKRIKTEIRARRSARHVPARVSTIAFGLGAPLLVRRAAPACSRGARRREQLRGEESLGRKLNPCNVACSCFCRSAVQIIQVEDIPYTVNMKRVEVPVKKVSCVFILGLARWRWISG